jgi:hypothetical protein
MKIMIGQGKEVGRIIFPSRSRIRSRKNMMSLRITGSQVHKFTSASWNTALYLNVALNKSVQYILVPVCTSLHIAHVLSIPTHQRCQYAICSLMLTLHCTEYWCDANACCCIQYAIPKDSENFVTDNWFCYATINAMDNQRSLQSTPLSTACFNHQIWGHYRFRTSMKNSLALIVWCVDYLLRCTYCSRAW